MKVQKVFLVKNYEDALNSDDFPIFSLTFDNWNDFGTQCLFQLKYHKSKSQTITIGEVKILQENQTKTTLPTPFTELEPTFISLGQDVSFYSSLLETVGRSDAIDFLKRLNDIAIQPEKAEPFEHTPQYRNSLMRENSALKSLRFGNEIISNGDYNEEFSFTYIADIKGSCTELELTFDFDDTDNLPHRIIGIIGKNGVGKTQLLASLANDLVQVVRKSKESINDRDVRFLDKRPIFSRVIAVSYSAFDKFTRPQNPPRSYVFCGLRNMNGNLSKRSLNQSYSDNLIKIRSAGNDKEWVKYMQHILGDGSTPFKIKLESEIESMTSTAADSHSALSSGQSILAHFVTAILARIQPNTIILFDEPETHLHPNAVANLFNVLNKILKDYESFAIMATHSPVVIQEIPSKRVLLLTREGDNAVASRMQSETFGESISELTRHVFDTVAIPNHYKKVIKQLAKRHTYEQVLELFDGDLSFNAKSYLMAQYSDEL